MVYSWISKARIILVPFHFFVYRFTTYFTSPIISFKYNLSIYFFNSNSFNFNSSFMIIMFFMLFLIFFTNNMFTLFTINSNWWAFLCFGYKLFTTMFTYNCFRLKTINNSLFWFFSCFYSSCFFSTLFTTIFSYFIISNKYLATLNIYLYI